MFFFLWKVRESSDKILDGNSTMEREMSLDKLINEEYSITCKHYIRIVLGRFERRAKRGLICCEVASKAAEKNKMCH